MSHARRQPQSPMMRHVGGIGEASSAAKDRVSYDSPGPSPWRDDERDDTEGGREEGARASEGINDEKVRRFDDLLKRIGDERKRMVATTAGSGTSAPQGSGTVATPRRRAERRAQSPASSNNYDFASRARELRMSHDDVPARSGTPKRTERDIKPEKFAQQARDTTPRSLGHSRAPPSPMKSRISDGMQSYTPRSIQSEGPSARHHFAKKARGVLPRSPARSSLSAAKSPSPVRPSFPPPSKEIDFKTQVEKFHGSLVSAHDSITLLERELRSVKRTVDEKDRCISSLEQSNKSVSEALTKCQHEADKTGQENHSLVAEKNILSKRHTDELEKLQSECDGYKKHAGEKLECSIKDKDCKIDSLQNEIQRLNEEQNKILKSHLKELEKLQSECDGYKTHAGEVDKLSAERYATAKEIESEKEKLVGSIQDKDNMIGSLRNEIQRLNDELADGSFVRSQALRAEETVKKLEAELEKSKTDHVSATKVIGDLEMMVKVKVDEVERELKEKDKEIATLQSAFMGGNQMKPEWMKDKVCTLESQRDDYHLKNNMISNKMKDLEKHLELAKMAAEMKEKDIKQFRAWSESREQDLKRQLEKERRESDRQQERLEKYDIDSAAEQETVTALERAIEELETAHSEGNIEITRLQNEEVTALERVIEELETAYDKGNSEIIRLEKENQSLTATLAEAEEYMKMYRNDMNDTVKLTSMLEEAQDINSDLGQQNFFLDQQVQRKDKEIKGLNESIASLEKQAETSSGASKQKILQLEKLAIQKQDDTFRLQATHCDSKNEPRVGDGKLVELTAWFEENKTELDELRTNKGRMLRTISKLEKELDEVQKESKRHALGTTLDHDQTEKVQMDARREPQVGEKEEFMEWLQDKPYVVRQQPEDGLKIEELDSELALVKKKLEERDEQLIDSRNGVAEAQKMIFRLMNTVQEIRKTKQ